MSVAPNFVVVPGALAASKYPFHVFSSQTLGKPIGVITSGTPFLVTSVTDTTRTYINLHIMTLDGTVGWIVIERGDVYECRL